MGKINNMRLKDILEQIGGVVSIDDEFINFSNKTEVIHGFKKLNKLNSDKEDAKRTKYLIDNEKDIDKEKLLFCIYLSYQESMNRTKEVLNKLSLKPNLNKDEQNLINEKQLLIKELSQKIQEIEELIKTQNIYLIDKDNPGIRIISSRKVMGLDENKSENTKKIRRLERMELRLSDEIKEGLNQVIEVLSISDLSAIMPTYKLGEEVKEFILQKWAKEKGIRINKLTEAEYEKTLSTVNSKEYSDWLSDAVLASVEFIDIDKLLLIIGYRMQEVLETGNAKKDEIKDFKLILSEVVNTIQNKDVSFKEKLENKTTKKVKEIEYSYKDLEDCLTRFKGEKYITKKETEEIKQSVLTGVLTLSDKSVQEHSKYIKLTENEIDEIMLYSTENFKYGIKYLKIKEEVDVLNRLKKASNLISKEFIESLYNDNIISIITLVELYNSGKISQEFCREFSQDGAIFSEVNFEEINEQYLQIKANKNAKEDEKLKLNNIIEFYKIVNLYNQSEDSLKQNYDNIMEGLAENPEFEEDIIFYYGKGLLSLEVIEEWTGYNFIQKLYDETIISFEDIEKSAINIQAKQAVLENIIIQNPENYDQNTLLEYIYKGYLSEYNILTLYKTALLNSTYADDMLNKGIISVPIYIEINSISKELLEKQTDVISSKLNEMQSKTFYINLEDNMEKSEIVLGGIPLSKQRNLPQNDKSENDEENYTNNKKTETLINPSIRWAFLKALKCKLPADNSFAHRNPESPFYNYEFFIIENGDSDEAQKDSIIIGERFFKNRVIEDEYATLNATYIWQYKDYLIAKKMVNSEQKKNKKAVTKETEGVVYVANHRPGSWAVSLLYKIAQTKAGENFNKYKKGDERANKVIEQLEKLYSYEELNDILEIARILDDEEKVILSNGNEIPTVYEVTYEDENLVSHEDNDER